MAAEHSISIPKANDRQVIDFFDQLHALQFTQASIGLIGGVAVHGEAELLGNLKKAKGFAIREASATREQNTVHFERGVRRANLQGQLHLEPSRTLDTIRITGRAADASTSIGISQLVEKSFLKAGDVDLANSESISEAISGHHQIISRLEQSATDIIQKLIDDRKALDQEYAQKQSLSDELLRRRQAEVEEERNNILREYAERAQALEAQRKEIDDRNNTHVRREISRQFKARLASYNSEFKLTQGTRRLRWPVHSAVAIALIAVVLAIIYFGATAVDPLSGWPYALSILRTTSLTLAAAILVWWYLRWLTAWSNQHAKVELQLRQLELDMDRASWVVETALEWKQQQGSAIPVQLLNSVSRNLFDSADKVDIGQPHPMDQLASALLGSASRAKLTLAGNELEFERGALKKAGKD